MANDTTLSEKSKQVTVTDPAVDADSREKLITARIALLLKAPFFGNLATRLQLINADDWCPTAATDGRKFYYNSEFIKTLPQKQIEFLVGHEVLHAVYDHMGRRGDRDPRLWNIADDYCVNQDLIDQHIGEFIPIGLHDEKYRGMSAEEVYDDLYENAEKISVDDLIEQLIDEHLDGDDGEGEGNNGKNDKGEGKSGSRPKLSEQEKKEIKEEMKEAVLQAAQSAGADKLPSGVRRLINQLTNPQLNWRELIQQQIQSQVKSDYSWMRPSRRGWHMDSVLPGTDLAETIDVCIAIDTSGSMGDDQLKDLLSEVKGIMESYDDFKLRVWTFDTEVYGMQEFTPDNAEDIVNYEMQGGGGTDFTANWEFMKANQIEPKLFIMFTDGWPWDSWGDPDYCDTLFIIHGGREIEAPFGVTAHYTFEKQRA